MNEAHAETHETGLAADSLLDVLVEWGIGSVFICPGSTEAAFLHEVSRRSDIDIILTTHESIAVSMADAHGRATGEPAVAYLHANVGLTNGLSHLYAAQLAHSPVVLLTGLKQTQIQGRGGFTTAPHMRDFVRQYSKWTWQSLRADAVASDVARALQVSATAPQGPTWVGLSQDLVEAAASRGAGPRGRHTIADAVRAPSASVTRTVDLLLTSRSPIIVAGADVASASSRGHGARLLAALAEQLVAPVFVEDRRGFERTVLPTSDPHFAGLYDVTRPSVAGSDLVLFVGAKCFLEFEAPVRSDVPVGAKLVHTHPDPAEVAKIHGVDVAAVSDSVTFLDDVLTELKTREPVARLGAAVEIAREEQQQVIGRVLPGPSADDRVTVGQVMDALSRTLDGGTLVVGDATTSGKALIHAVECSEATIHTTSSGSLGWGVGAALGFKLAQPEKRVVAVCGDGAFQFGIPGLWTAVRYNIDVTYIVVNNESYAAVGAAIRRYAGSVTDEERALTVDLAGPRLSAVAEGFGLRGFVARTLKDFTAALEAAAQAKGPCLVEVVTDPLDMGP
ncbi:thiamine pyrophosphate-binding protein [Aeromicrobium sp. CTD01-1L150]|uniref:thiamine pyrophosphate-binding protein n=1 Tax=Aeromicrobium sp. CTD01-1L150 TaxID=3341830 RepID=UPI0035C1AE94